MPEMGRINRNCKGCWYKSRKHEVWSSFDSKRGHVTKTTCAIKIWPSSEAWRGESAYQLGINRGCDRQHLLFDYQLFNQRSYQRSISKPCHKPRVFKNPCKNCKEQDYASNKPETC